MSDPLMPCPRCPVLVDALRKYCVLCGSADRLPRSMCIEYVLLGGNDLPPHESDLVVSRLRKKYGLATHHRPIEDYETP